MSRRKRRRSKLPVFVTAGVVTAALAGWLILRQSAEDALPAPERSGEQADFGTPSRKSITESDIRRFCSTCHVFAEPSLMPKIVWPAVVDRMYRFVGAQLPELARSGVMPDRRAVEAWFVKLAPEELPPPAIKPEGPPSNVRFSRHDFGGKSSVHGVSQTTFIRRSSQLPDVLVADLRAGNISVFQVTGPAPGRQLLADISAPARVEPVDLDGDGHGDFVVANLGRFEPSNERIGQVVWLRYVPETAVYEPIILAQDLGRVADLRAADMDGDGDVDLVVAVFGWTEAGELLYFENRTADFSRPEFRRRKLDRRTGAMRLQLADLNGDGLTDIIALFSQAYEDVVAFLNEGDGNFSGTLVYEARNPDFGFSGMQIADIDGDGDIDILVTNGDSTDIELLKPQHGVRLLENQGTFPFEPHLLTAFPGAYDVAAADLDNDGDQDIVAVAWLPVSNEGPTARRDTPHFDLYNARDLLRLSSIIWLEQTAPLVFDYHTIEKIYGDHVTVDVADYDGDGDLDLVTGNLSLDGMGAPPQLPARPGEITIWENTLIQQQE